MQILAQESRDVVHVDDVAGKESMWHAVRRSCEQKLKYSREHEVHEDVDKCKGIASEGEEAFEGESTKIKFRFVASSWECVMEKHAKELELESNNCRWQVARCLFFSQGQTQYSL